MARKVNCAKKDGQFCSTLFPEILSDNVSYKCCAIIALANNARLYNVSGPLV